MLALVRLPLREGHCLATRYVGVVFVPDSVQPFVLYALQCCGTFRQELVKKTPPYACGIEQCVRVIVTPGFVVVEKQHEFGEFVPANLLCERCRESRYRGTHIRVLTPGRKEHCSEVRVYPRFCHFVLAVDIR